MLTRFISAVLAVAVMALVVPVAAAQETTSGSIAGRIADSQGLALPGATIEIVSAQGTKVFTTDAEGRFVAPFLVPGPHTLRVRMEGFQAVERAVDVRLGQRVDVNLMLTVALTDSVEVLASAPVVDITSTTAGATMDGQRLSQIPLGRTFTDVLYAAPGVSSGGGVGDANASIAGASGLENMYSVDGVNITNTGFGGVGSYSGTILGALILSVLNALLTFLDAGQAVKQVVYGLIVLGLAWVYAAVTRAE